MKLNLLLFPSEKNALITFCQLFPATSNRTVVLTLLQVTSIALCTHRGWLPLSSRTSKSLLKLQELAFPPTALSPQERMVLLSH